MHLRLKASLAAVVMVAMMVVAGVCAGKAVAETEAKAKLPDPMTIGSMITIKGGHQGLDEVKLTIEHFPPSASGPPPITIPLAMSPGPALPPEQEALLVSTISFATTIGTAGAEALIVKLAPIPGWKATPEEYRLTANNEHADFTLEKAPVSSNKIYWLMGICALGAVILVGFSLVFLRREKGKKETGIA